MMNAEAPENAFKITTIGWWGAYPSAGEATSGYLLQSDGLNILGDTLSEKLNPKL
jgi:ribonuclease BN (tRNA processing enzyme)